MKIPGTFLLVALLAYPFAALAQTGVGIGTTAPHPSAALDVSSPSQGLLPPRLTQAQRDAIANPAAGLLIFNTDAQQANQWDGTHWVAPLALDATSAVLIGYTGGPQTYTVPAGVTSLRVELAGASGGTSFFGQPGGLGGRVQATLAVTPGQQLTLFVGGAGSLNSAGYNGGGGASFSVGGGGGATDLRAGGAALANRVLVAGGGGGGGDFGAGGCGGGPRACAGAPAFGNTGGEGGGPTGPGAGGSPDGLAGSGAAGGNTSSAGGGAGGAGGAGGGGYWGGGGGGSGAGGGGGSSYAGAGTTAVVNEQGTQSGNGYVRLTPSPAALPAPLLDARNFSNLPAPTLSVAGQSLSISGGNTVTLPLPAGDNLGNHRATQNLNLNGYLLTGGGSAGLRLDNAGRVGIGPAAPRGPLDVSANGDTYLVADPANGNSQTLFLPGHLYLAPFSGTNPTAYIQARVPSPNPGTNLGLTLRTTYAGSLVDAVAVAPSGKVTLAGSVAVTGSVEMGLVAVSRDFTLSGNSYVTLSVDCPAGTQLLSGGGGYPDSGAGQYDIVLNYSGPDDTYPLARWTIRVNNNSKSARAIRVRCNCARIR